MIVYKLTDELKQKYEQIQNERKEWNKIHAVIEELTGIKPTACSEGGTFMFRADIKREDLPDFLKMNREGRISPRHSTRKGKELVKEFDKHNFPDIHPFHIRTKLGLPMNVGFKIDTVGGELCFVDWSHFDPADLGCEKAEV